MKSLMNTGSINICSVKFRGLTLTFLFLLALVSSIHGQTNDSIRNGSTMTTIDHGVVSNRIYENVKWVNVKTLPPTSGEVEIKSFTEFLKEKFARIRPDSLQHIKTLIQIDFKVDSSGHPFDVKPFLKGNDQLTTFVMQSIIDMPHWRTLIRENSLTNTFTITVKFPNIEVTGSYNMIHGTVTVIHQN